MNNRPLIEVKAVSKTYRRGQLSVPALSNISFGIEPSEFVILVGSSGAGKTTLLNLLAALDWPDQGEIIVYGKNIAHLSLWAAASYRRLQLGIIFQAYLLAQSCKKRQATLILATHDIRSFEGADRVFTLQAGLLQKQPFRSV